MKDYAEKVQLELDYSDLSDIVGSLITRIERMIEIKGPSVLIKKSIERAEKLNQLLKKENFDCWEDDKFLELMEKISG